MIASLQMFNNFIISEDKGTKTRENHQMTITLILVCMAFLVLATPLYTLIAVFSFLDARVSPHRFAIFTLTKNIFEQVSKMAEKFNEFSEFKESDKSRKHDLELTQFDDSVSHMRLVRAVVASWSLTHEVAGLNPFTIMITIFVTEFAEFNENI